jgi:hypothetical protein
LFERGNIALKISIAQAPDRSDSLTAQHYSQVGKPALVDLVGLEILTRVVSGQSLRAQADVEADVAESVDGRRMG